MPNGSNGAIQSAHVPVLQILITEPTPFEEMMAA
jgi:hypothetical protein